MNGLISVSDKGCKRDWGSWEGQSRQAGQKGLSGKVAYNRDLDKLRMGPWIYLVEENSSTREQPM